MGVPVDKTTRSKRDMRRSHHALVRPQVHLCPQCNAVSRPHQVCRECGYYKGREVVAVKQ